MFVCFLWFLKFVLLVPRLPSVLVSQAILLNLKRKGVWWLRVQWVVSAPEVHVWPIRFEILKFCTLLLSNDVHTYIASCAKFVVVCDIFCEFHKNNSLYAWSPDPFSLEIVGSLWDYHSFQYYSWYCTFVCIITLSTTEFVSCYVHGTGCTWWAPPSVHAPVMGVAASNGASAAPTYALRRPASILAETSTVVVLLTVLTWLKEVYLVLLPGLLVLRSSCQSSLLSFLIVRVSILTWSSWLSAFLNGR